MMMATYSDDWTLVTVYDDYHVDIKFEEELAHFESVMQAKNAIDEIRDTIDMLVNSMNDWKASQKEEAAT